MPFRTMTGDFRTGLDTLPAHTAMFGTRFGMVKQSQPKIPHFRLYPTKRNLAYTRVCTSISKYRSLSKNGSVAKYVSSQIQISIQTWVSIHWILTHAPPGLRSRRSRFHRLLARKEAKK